MLHLGRHFNNFYDLKPYNNYVRIIWLCVTETQRVSGLGAEQTITGCQPGLPQNIGGK